MKRQEQSFYAKNNSSYVCYKITLMPPIPQNSIKIYIELAFASFRSLYNVKMLLIKQYQ